jgi:hypothetical protein
MAAPASTSAPDQHLACPLEPAAIEVYEGFPCSPRGGPNSLSAHAGQNKYVSVGASSSSISVPSMARQPSIQPSPTLPHSAHRTIAAVRFLPVSAFTQTR